MRLIRDVLSLTLVASALVGMQILLTDKWLWSAAPSHAYGLIGFIIVDFLLTAMLSKNAGAGTLGAAFVSVVQLGAMVGDMFFGMPSNVPSAAFRAYLINDASYLALLIINFAIVVVAIVSMMTPLLHRQLHWTGLVPRPRPRT